MEVVAKTHAFYFLALVCLSPGSPEVPAQWGSKATTLVWRFKYFWDFTDKRCWRTQDLTGETLQTRGPRPNQVHYSTDERRCRTQDLLTGETLQTRGPHPNQLLLHYTTDKRIWRTQDLTGKTLRTRGPHPNQYTPALHYRQKKLENPRSNWRNIANQRSASKPTTPTLQYQYHAGFLKIEDITWRAQWDASSLTVPQCLLRQNVRHFFWGTYRTSVSVSNRATYFGYKCGKISSKITKDGYK